jgi:4-aminobutyrate aminotransferase
MARNQELQARKEAATPRGVSVLCGIFADHAKNAEIWDVEGRRFIDFAGGIGVLNTGHQHPRVVAAVSAQLQKLSHTCYTVVPYELYISVAERLNALTPGDHPKKTAFFTTGAEAVENAVKIARYHTGRPGVISFFGGYHGRTNLTLAMTGKVAPYKLGVGPFPADVYHAPYPNALYGVSVSEALRELGKLFLASVEPARVAAIVIEPLQGEGGFYVTPFEFLRALRALCDQHGIVLIADEVQSGFARTGKLFAMEHSGVIPDLQTMAKSLAGGYPLSAVTGRAEIMDAPAPGGLGGTYAGNPIALAAAEAVLDVIAEEKLCERAVTLGAKLRTLLERLAGEIPAIAEVRGLGGMIAVELMKPGTREPDPELTRRVQQRALDAGLILLTAGMYGNVLRFLFPLTIEDAVFDEGLRTLEAALRGEGEAG